MGNGAQFESHLHSGAVAGHTDSSGTCSQDGTPAQGEPEPNPGSESLSSGKPMPRVKLGKYLQGTKWIPSLGPGPVLDMTNFTFRESLGNVLWGLFLLLFWGFGVMFGGVFGCFFKFQHGCFSPSASSPCRTGMDGLGIHFP